MSDLTQFRDHARSMTKAEHAQECIATTTEAKHRWSYFVLFREWPEHWGVRPSGPPKPCPGGCIADSDRLLWARLADEIDGYLHVDDEPTLFEETP